MRIVPLLLILAAPLQTWAQAGGVSSMAGREVTSQTGLSNTTPQLATRAVSAQSKQELEQKLRESGVTPNSEAFSIIYTMNPALLNVTDVGKFNKVKIPVIVGFDSKADELAQLLVDARIKRDIRLQENTLNSHLAANLTLKPASERLEQVSAAIVSHPASRKMLEQVGAEGHLLADLSAKTLLTEKDKTVIAQVQDDLTAKAGAITGEAPDPDIVVNTVGAGDHRSQSRL